MFLNPRIASFSLVSENVFCEKKFNIVIADGTPFVDIFAISSGSGASNAIASSLEFDGNEFGATLGLFSSLDWFLSFSVATIFSSSHFRIA